MNVKLKNSNLLISKQKEEIELQKKDLTDSISYARRIQTAILKRNIDLYPFVNDYFVFFRPAAIVSGDFYWFHYSNNKLIIVAADCTGHGVPGAFMSLIGMYLLNHFVEGEKIFMPDEILANLNSAVFKTLDQENNDNFDGMDAAVCTVDFNEKKLYFSGARRPLFINVNGKTMLVKGSIASVGGPQDVYNQFGKYELKTFDISSPVNFYLFSDGYFDQTNNAYKKIGSKRFYDLISQSIELPLNEQCEIMESFFDNWKAQSEQVDDVMVLGFSLK